MTNVGKAVVMSTLVVLLGVSCGLGQDWPQWRGPNRDGKLRGFAVPQSWPKELTRKWKVTVGVGDSSPALVGDRLYVFGRQDANEVIRCLDAASGAELWHNSYPAQFVATGPSSRHPGTRSSPLVVDGKLCVLGLGGILSCLDAATGKVLWRKQSAADYLDTPAQFESSMSPLVADGMCLAYIGGKGQGAIIAFDLASGRPRWKYTGAAPSPSSPVVATIAGVRQIVTLDEKEVIGVSLADRTLLWQVPFKGRPVNATTPVVDGSTVYVTGEGLGTLAIQVASEGGKFTATASWTNSDAAAAATFTTPVLRDGLLFGYAATKLNCLDARTGRVLWADTVNRGRSAAVIDAGSCLIALTLNGDLSFYRPSDKQYLELARYQVGEPEFWAHPIFSGQNIFIRDKESLTRWTIP